MNVPYVKSAVTIAVVVMLVSVAPGPAVGTHEDDKPTKTQYSFRADLGDEVYGSQNVHYPGDENGSIVLYITAEGQNLDEPFTLDTLVTYSGLDTRNCEVTDVTAGGIDRDNDERYTATDKSLISSFKGQGNKTSDTSDLGPEDDPGPIAPEEHTFRQKSWISFWQEEDFGGEPTTFYPPDEGILALQDCIIGPDAPGWYRGWGRVNGTTNSGEYVNHTAFSNWNYVCKCDSYDEAVETIGPPPNTGYTAERGYINRSEETPTETADGDETTATATETATATATASTTATATDAGTTATETAAVTTTAADEGATAGTATPTDESPGEASGQATPTVTGTTDGTGPGFGTVAAAVALLGLVVRYYRRE